MNRFNKIDNDEKSDEDRINRLKKLSTPNIVDGFNKLKIKGQLISDISSLYSLSSPLCGLASTAVYASIDDPSFSLFENNRYLLDEFPKNKHSRVLFLENQGKPQLASIWGSLMSLYAKQKGIVGTVTNGFVRDAKEINIMQYPVFCSGICSQSSHGIYKVIAFQKPIQLYGVTIYPGDYVLADESGIAIIPSKYIDEVLMLAEQKQKNEQQIIRLIQADYSFKEIDAMLENKVDDIEAAQKNYSNLSTFF